MSVAVVTDTSACLPDELVEEYGIELVPMEFTYQGRVHRDGIDTTPKQFYELLESARELPKTSAPPPGAFLAAFEKLAKKHSQILVITLTARFSHVYESALLAAETARKKIRDVEIEVLDSQTAAGAQGLVVMAAARAAGAGKNLPEIVASAREIMSKVHLVAFIDTIYYMAKGGRVPQVLAMANSVLNIKPVFELLPMGHGVAGLGVARNREKATKSLVDFTRKKANGNPLHAMVMHTNILSEAENLSERLKREFTLAEIYTRDFTPVMGVHTGPGLLAIAFYPDTSIRKVGKTI